MSTRPEGITAKVIKTGETDSQHRGHMVIGHLLYKYKNGHKFFV